MLTEERRQVILDRLARDGRVVVADLSSSLDMSLDTIRRDLQELADAGLVRRVHGGALPPAVGSRTYAARREQAPAAKAAIANATVDLLRDGQVILLDAGTTTLEVARHLPGSLQATVITNSPPIAVALAEHPSVEVTMLGGNLDKDALALVGRGDGRGAPLRAGRRPDPRRLQRASRDRHHRARSRGVVREARDDRERRRGRRGLLCRQARLRGHRMSSGRSTS